ncbi:hypothetical protein PG5_27020 [Pseudomonas sp. G5(2012)]|nr:hypothetical protein PG5_27020 [Pseudomonas sp. G5(2012)]
MNKNIQNNGFPLIQLDLTKPETIGLPFRFRHRLGIIFIPPLRIGKLANF